jgi:hypothetical protein
MLGFGLGLRPAHYESILASAPAVDWFEVLTENYLSTGGRPLHYLDAVRSRYPVTLHGVSLSIGSTDPLDEDYLRQLVLLAARCEPAWISDHLCWTGVGGINTHDLLPLPYTRDAIDHVSARIHAVQDRLRRPLVLENVSSYIGFSSSEMPEWEFLASIARKTGCQLLLDINNIYVNHRNSGLSPAASLEGIPTGTVRQVHLAGHQDLGDHCIDTHDAPVSQPVWELYESAIRRFGPVSTLLERDDNIPPLHELVGELDVARKIASTLAHSPPRGGPAQ